MKIQHMALGAVMAAVALTAGAQSAERKPYLVQLSVAPAAAYEGGIRGLAATRPAPGALLDTRSRAVQAYLNHIAGQVSRITSTVPSATVYHRYGTVLSGFAAMLTPAELDKLRKTPGVEAVMEDEPRQLDTSYTTSTFLGLGLPGGVWSQLDANGKNVKGEDVIVAHVDSGVWPENTSFSDKVDANGKAVPYYAAGTVVYDPLPVGRFKGSCQAGEAFTPAMCNNKLVGARVFNTTFKLFLAQNGLVIWPLEYDSPRDESGHGSHTLGTAGGNGNSPVSVQGSPFTVSGVAPRARLASYKACNSYINASGVRQNSCFTGDLVSAIEQAVSDGANVINYSISGSQTSFVDLVEQAFKAAVKAGVFVSTSAGNSGPANTVAHISPWNMTVGNSTHDRYTEAIVSLGAGGTAQGASFQTGGVPVAPLIWARDAGFSAVPALPGTNQAHCYGAADGVAPLLDPAKVAGKIVVCDRGGNVLVFKAANAKTAGAVGVIILNRPAEGAVPASGNTTPLISAVLPVVHLAVSHFAAVTAEARREDINNVRIGTAAFSGSAQVAGVVAPQMSNSSSRGPNRGDPNVLKPDITAPGSDIIAAYTTDVDAAERALLIAGTINGRQGADMISGTSMSSPHVAGAAALLKQARPTWSPAAIKSALMTSATQIVKVATGAADGDRWGYGSGHLAPQGALATTVVYDVTGADFDAYQTGALPGSNLNLPSITLPNILGSASTTRTLTNKGASTVTLNASSSMTGYTVTATPATLTIAPGASATYTATVTRTTATLGAYVFGNLTWTGSGQTLVSPVTARSQTLVAYTALEETRDVGSRLFTVGFGYTGTSVTTPTGMVPATRTTGRVATNAQVCTPVVVPAGTLAFRAQLHNSETEDGASTDLDLTVHRGTTLVGSSGGTTSNELVMLTNPTAATNYSVCVVGFATVSGSASFVLNTYVVTPPGPGTLRAAGPRSVVQGGTGSIAASWAIAPGTRALGAIRYSQTTAGATLGMTTLFVDAVAPVPVQNIAPLLLSKPER